MRRFALAILLFALAGSTIAQQPTETRKKTDLELLQGIWEITGLENGGKAQPAGNYKGNTFTFTKDKARLREIGFQSIEFTFALDPSKSPKTIELTTRGNLIHGIYKLDDDELTLTVSLGGLRPPGEFATKAGGDSETFLLKRSLWERYTDKTHGFVVDLPPRLTETTRNDAIPGGKAATSIVTARDDSEKLTFAVSVTPMPGPLGMREGEAALDAALKTLVADVEKLGKVRTEAEGKFKQPPGVGAAREYTITWAKPNSKEKGAMRARLYAAGDRVYALTATGSEDAVRSPTVYRFWSSFGPPLPPPKKDPPPKY